MTVCRVYDTREFLFQKSYYNYFIIIVFLCVCALWNNIDEYFTVKPGTFIKWGNKVKLTSCWLWSQETGSIKPKYFLYTKVFGLRISLADVTMKGCSLLPVPLRVLFLLVYSLIIWPMVRTLSRNMIPWACTMKKYVLTETEKERERRCNEFTKWRKEKTNEYVIKYVTITEICKFPHCKTTVCNSQIEGFCFEWSFPLKEKLLRAALGENSKCWNYKLLSL